jgi:hypothetical protein
VLIFHDINCCIDCVIISNSTVDEFISVSTTVFDYKFYVLGFEISFCNETQDSFLQTCSAVGLSKVTGHGYSTIQLSY